jgi:phosphoribosylcarboxyaminoimidazole (NCAIR) mutase
MVAAMTALPVIGVPVKGTSLDGVQHHTDACKSIFFITSTVHIDSADESFTLLQRGILGFGTKYGRVSVGESA